jgi:hypothetical protein
VSVELEMWLVRLDGLVRLGVLVVVLGTNAMTTVAAVVSSSEPVMVMAVAVAVVSKELDALHVHSPSSCGQPVQLVSPVPHAQAQVYQGY